MTITDLQIACEMLNVRLEHHSGGPLGWFCSTPPRTISIREGLSTMNERCVLAHELGHAVYNDRACGGRWGSMQEQRVNRFAARLLINRQRLINAILWRGHDMDGIAIDLEVTPDILKVFLQFNPPTPEDQEVISGAISF